MNKTEFNPMNLIKLHSKRIFFMLIVFVICMGFYFLNSSTQKPLRIIPNTSKYQYWPPFISDVPASSEWYKTKCFNGNFKPGIHSIGANMDEVKESGYFLCKKLILNFNDIFNITYRIGKLKMGVLFEKKVSGWLGNNKQLLKEVRQQRILHVKNRYTLEYTAFNPLRAKRPFVKPKVDPLKYIGDLVDETRKTCDFCRYEKFTAEDDLGRIVTNISATASNTFKYDAYHQIVFTKATHNPLELSKEEIVDMFMTANIWFEKVHDKDNSYKYPLIMWDTFPHGGASQVHPHIQISMDKFGYYGSFESLRNAADKYCKSHEELSNYFTDLKDIHFALGLTHQHGEATALAHINAHKDYEIMILSESVNNDVFELLYFVVKALNEDLQQYTFSFAGIFPSMEDGAIEAKMPVVLRILSRSSVSSMNADISSLELFLLYNVNTDPYKVIDAIRKSAIKRS